MRWPWQRRPEPNGELDAARQARAASEAKLRVARKMRPAYEQMAQQIADLPPEEFVARARRAFGAR